MESTPLNSSDFASPQPHHFYAELFNQLPVLVVRLTTDGIVLEINTQVTLVTGFAPDQLVGKNFWATLFPGKLFAQVPRFISPVAPWGLFRDYPMAIRTRNGVEKIIAWTRFMRAADSETKGGGGGKSTRQEIICIGQDLTQRLTDAEKKLVDQQKAKGQEELDVRAAGVAKQNHGESRDGEPGKINEVEGETIEPLAISPPRPPGGTVTPEALAHLQESLEALGQRMASLQVIVADSQLARVRWLSEMASPGAMDKLSPMFMELERAGDPETIGIFEHLQATTKKMSKLCARGKSEDENL